MRQRDILFSGLIIGVFILNMGARCGKQDADSGTTELEPSKDDPVWILVNGHEIRKSSIDREMNRIKAQLPADQFAAYQATIKRDVMQGAAQKAVLDQMVTKEAITVDSAEVDQEIENIKSRYPDDTFFQQKLIEMKVTEEDLKKDIAQNLRYKMLFDKKIQAPPPTEEEIMAVYEQAKNLPQLQQPPKLEATHIVLMVPPSATDEARQKKKERAEEARRKILSGEDMESIIQEYSESPTKANQGKETFVKGQTMTMEFDQAVFGLAQGEISEVIETPVGFHVVRVDNIIPERTTPLEEVRDDIIAHLDQQKKGPMFQQYLSTLVSEAKIEYVEPLPEPAPMPGMMPGAMPPMAPEEDEGEPEESDAETVIGD